jgi:signal peptidase II
MRLAAPRLVLLGGILAGVIILADQASTWWLLNGLMQQPRVIELTPFFNLVTAWNRGVSFSLLHTDSASGPFILSAVSVVISIVLAIWLLRVSKPLTAIAIGLVIGGALGNVIDRLRFGAVFDFLDVYWRNYHWPAFNLADSAIVTGVVLLLLDGLFHGSEQGKN